MRARADKQGGYHSSKNSNPHTRKVSREGPGPNEEVHDRMMGCCVVRASDSEEREREANRWAQNPGMKEEDARPIPGARLQLLSGIFRFFIFQK